MASANIAKLVNLNRFQSAKSCLPLFFYIPLGVVLTILRCFIFLQALLVFLFISKIPFVRSILSVLLRCMFAVCGLVVTTDGSLQTDRRPLVLVANHATSLDPFVLSLIMQYTMVVEPSSPSGDLTHLCSQLNISGDMSKEDSLQFIKKSMEDSRLPLLLFPEGGRANSLYGLMKFRVLPFQLDASIQPIGIITKRCFSNINISTFSSPWWADLLLCFFVPFTIYNIKYMPLTEPRESETSERFSQRVQSNLARGLGVTATELTLSDVKEFTKAELQRRPVTSNSSSPPSAPSSGSAPKESEDTKTKIVPEEVSSSDPVLNVMVKQVREVLPHASSLAVLRDLEDTRDVDATITNILEGRVDLQQKEPSPQPSPSQTEMENSTFKAANFPKSASDRQMSLQERKQAMLEAARKRYKEKHGIP